MIFFEIYFLIFFDHHQLKIIFQTVNCKLEKINHWFKKKRLSLNMEKNKLCFILKKFYQGQNSFKNTSIENRK